jgi:chromosome segregation ATPase
MHAQTLDILIERAHLEPEQAHAIGTAIENEITSMQVVTEPVFKAGIAELRTEFKTDLSDVRAEVADVRAEVADVRAEVAELRGEVKQLRTEVTEIRGEVKQLRTEVTEIRADVTQLRGEFTQLRGEFTQLRGEVTQLHRDVAGIRIEMSRMETRLVWKLAGTLLVGFSVMAGALVAALRLALSSG